MPTISPDTPRVAAKYADITVQAPAPYAEGHALTANEATFVNRQLSSVIGNMFAGAIRRKLTAAFTANEALFTSKDPAVKATARTDTDAKGKVVPHVFTLADLPPEHWQAAFDAIWTDYEPGVSNRGAGAGTSSDPVEKAALRISGEKVRELYRTAKRKAKDFYDAKSSKYEGHSVYEEHVRDFLAANPWVHELAQAQVTAMANAPVSFDFTAAQPAPAPTEAPTEAQPQAAE